MRNRMFVRPRKLEDGTVLRIRDPETGTLLPEEGAMKPATQHWQRRVKCGDCLTSRPPTPRQAVADFGDDD